MSVALEELRREMGRMKTHIVSQGEELLRLKRATGEDGSHMGSKRLTDIECELGEQKKSTEKITKLCLAAIKALEKLEKAPIEFSSLEQCNQASQESIERGNSVDPVIVKTMCEQLDVINKLLIKVDDDIEAVDEKAESSLADYEQLNLRMTEIDKRIKESKDSTMGEVRALLVSRTYATREDLSRAIATAQASKQSEANATAQTSAQVGLNKEEVASMIEKATSNFLRTVHADTASCTERTQDCEELVKAELSKLGAKLNETDKFARTEARQIQDTTDKNMKEVTRTLASLVEQHRTKTSSENAEAFERLNRRLDNEVKNFSDMVKEVKDLGLKEAEESKLLTRLERLAKDVTALKADQVKLGQAMEQCVSHQSSLDIQTKNMTKIVEQQKEEVSKLGKKQEEGAKIDKLGKLENTVVDLGQKVEGINGKLSKNKEETGKMEKLGKLETTVGDLGQKIESIGRLGDTLVLECSKKVDKTELDEIKNGMEKERCKINYFQDKILNIAKVAETAKADTGSLKDKLTTEMAQTTNKMQTITGQVDKHSEDIKEHCEALKGITRDSIGKIKDVATNCAQIEANIRNIRDKSVVFDNELKSIKEQLAHTTYKLEENKEQEAAKDVKMAIKEKEEEVKKLGESLDAVKKKVQLNSMELSNIKEDKRTKEGETEERQQSLEQNLLDVRTYVERMLQETNKQLAGITGEVESTDRKIKRCSADILDIINRQERASGDSSTALAGLETQVRELQEQEVMRRVELAGEMLELRGGANDKQAEVLEKVQTAVDGVAGLRRETQGNMDKLESQVSLLHDAGAERERKAGIALAGLKDTLESKVTGLETRVTGVVKEVEAVKKESKTGTETCTESMGKIQLKLAGFMQADETRAMQVKTVKEALERVEKEAGTWKKEDSNKKEKLKEELEGVLKNIDAVKNHVDTRVENMRKNMIDMIGNNEMKTGEIEQKLKETDITVKNMGIVQNNQQPILESKLMTVKDEIEKTVIDKLKVKNPSTIELENATAALRKDIDQVKTEIKDNDLEGFKNIVNNTNETQNKLITSIQKNIDEMNREKCEMEGQMTIMDERITQVSILREAGEKELKVNIKKEQESGERLGEKVQTLALGLREIQASTAAMANIDSVEQVKTSLSSLKDDVSETKLDLGRRVSGNQVKIAELEEQVNTELGNIKTTMTSSGQAMQKKTLEEFSEMSRSIKEKSDLAENKLNETLEIIQSHTKSIEALQETSAEVSKNKESCETQLQKMEFKVSSCVEELAKLDQFAKVTEVRKLEKALGDKSGMTETVAVQNKLAQLSQETQNSLRDLATRHGAVETALTTVQTQLAKVSDVSGMVEDVSTISGKVNQQKAKLIDIEANVALQERSNTKLSEDVRKIGTDFTGNLSKMEERLDSMDSNKKELSIKMSEIEKANSELSKEMASLTGLKTKVPIWDRKADCEELDKLNLLLTEEVNRIQKEIKDVKKRNEEIQAEKEEVKEEEVKVSQEQFKDLDTNFSRLSDIVENMQCRLENHQENNTQQIEQVNTSIKSLRKGLDTLSHESKQSGALNMIDKQRRGWEEAREKAEQMSQIFDSLIITNDRPYVSCGLESPASCPGLLDFSQFELINKVGWDSEDLMFTILEPGVYMLQMGGNLCGASVVAKMVNEDVEAEVVTLEGGAQLSFRSRSTIFTVEDDDQAAERLLVEVVEQGEEDVRVEKDFSLLLYKISEVSQAEGPECLQGDFIKA